jgi:hypothetical protein
MTMHRRSLLMSTLFGAGYVGLRALATGLPIGVLANGRRAFADGSACPAQAQGKAQFFILATSGLGDPLNANVPGSCDIAGNPHPQPTDGSMALAKMTIAGAPYQAALPWTQVPPDILARTGFWHIMTNTPVHPREGDVLSLLDATRSNEMLVSMLAKQLAPCLGTIQQQPITLGATTPSEGLKFGGQALPIIPPLALKATLTNPSGPLEGLTTLQAIRDQTLAQLSDLYASGATKAQKAYLDALILSQQELRNIRQDLLGALGTITDNSVASQITAAVTLIQMKVTPVVAIHIPFGGDNHFDTGLANEAAQTVSGVASIVQLVQALQSAGLQDQVSFISLNVFGRTLGPSNTDGRQHNPNHQVSLAIGTPFKSAVIGGLGPVAGDYGCLPIDSGSGAGTTSGDIATADTLASFGKTIMAAVGIDAATIDASINGGKVVTGALA